MDKDVKVNKLLEVLTNTTDNKEEPEFETIIIEDVDELAVQDTANEVMTALKAGDNKSFIRAMRSLIEILKE